MASFEDTSDNAFYHGQVLTVYEESAMVKLLEASKVI